MPNAVAQFECGAVKTVSVGDQLDKERRHLSSPDGNRFVCLHEAGINALGVGKRIWEQRAGPKGHILEEPLAREVFQSMQYSLAQHRLLEKSPVLISSSSVTLVVNIYVVRQRATGGDRKTA